MPQTTKSVDTISRLVEDMQSRLPSEPPRSLCELRLSKSEYDNLCLWAKERLTRSMIRLSGWRAGAIILILITEVARREAIGHRLWPIVAEKFSDDVRRLLFPNNHPSADLKQWIQQAVRHLNLRHVFDDDEKQGWYITTHLQFGIAAHGFRARLPEWLCGQYTPDSVRRLLIGDLASESFQDLWQALRFYRRDWIAEEELRLIIEKSPWVLAEWQDDLVRLAREKLHLIDFEEGSESDELPTPDLVQDVEVEWEYDVGPKFKCKLADLEQLELIAPHYHLMVDETALLSLFRQHDGTYRADSNQVEFSASVPLVYLNLIDPVGEVHHSQLVHLWDSSADVNVFNLSSGKKVDSECDQMSESRSYFFILQPDLRLEPSSDTWVRLTGSSPRIAVLLDKNWDSSSTRVVMSDGTVLWSPQVRTAPLRQAEPQQLQHVSVQPVNHTDTISIGDSVTTVIKGVPEGFHVAYVRYCGRPLTFDPHTNELSKLIIAPEDANAGLVFSIGVCRLGVRNGEITHLRRSLDAVVVGTARVSEAGWEAIQSRSVITSRECRESSFRVYLPNKSDITKVALMEGPRLLKWLGQRAAPLGRVHGIGAPLVVRSQPYNCDSELLTIARGCTNGGIIKGVEFEHDGAESLQIQLTRPLELSTEHCVIAWPCGDHNEPLMIDPQNITSSDSRRTWSVVSSPCGVGKKSIVAISFKGRWLGSATADDPLNLLHSLADFSQNKHLVASLVRWFRLPILLSDQGRDVPTFANFAHKCPDAVLTAWISAEGLPHSLKHDEGFDRHQVESVQLRDLYLGWIPDSNQVSQIIEALGTNEQDPLGDVVIKLLLELPLVTGHIMKHWLADVGPPQNMPLKFYLDKVLRPQFGQKLNKSGKSNRMQDSDPLSRAASNMNVGPNASADEFFVKNAIADPAISTLSGHTLTGIEKSNLAVAMQLAPFRQYLASRVLDEIEKG
ncbi:hypothetical protein [Gimesia sp.]|uniref:hypothetical protein n=1 Tax=Gimesia sp. TaxID=2024833 RepID=UPI003A8C92B4